MGLHDLTLRHYSHKPVGALKPVESQVREDGRDGFKPRGFWVSVDDDYGWRNWCEAEDFNTGWAHVYNVRLREDANILLVSNLEEFDAFNAEYRCPPPWAERLRSRLGPGSEIDYGELEKFGYIDWARVAERYDGIVIAPYFWERRLYDETHWYYTWDCASGCVWNTAVITSLEEVPLEEIGLPCPQTGPQPEPALP